MAQNDLVFVLPGVMGSTLTTENGLIWSPSAGATLRAIKTLGKNLDRLRLPDDIGHEDPRDGVTASALMPDLHIIPGVWTPMNGYDKLLSRLHSIQQEGKVGRIVPFPYDWRLSNRFNASTLSSEVERHLSAWRDSSVSRRDAMAIFVCHSMGGIIARWYVEMLGGSEVTRQLITMGTPYRGAAKAAEQLVNGVHKGIGLMSVDLTETVRSFPSLYQLLPTYACCDSGGVMLKIGEVGLPELDRFKVNEAITFNRELESAEAARPVGLDDRHTIAGIRQPTGSSIRLDGGRLEVLQTIQGEEEFGDATVSTVGSLGHGLPPNTNRIRRIACRHGALQSNTAVLDEVEAIITSRAVRRRGSDITIRVEFPDLLFLGDTLTIVVDFDSFSDRLPAVQVSLTPERAGGDLSQAVELRQPLIRDRRAITSFIPARPGAYNVRVTSVAPGAIAPIEGTTLIW